MGCPAFGGNAQGLHAERTDEHRGRFVLAMAAGSILGAALGGQLLGVVPSEVLLPVLAAILLISAVKVWRHK